MFRDKFLEQPHLESTGSVTGDYDEENEEELVSWPTSSFEPSLYTIWHWDTTRSHPKLQISHDSTSVYRADHFELYPVAMARGVSTLTQCACQLRYDRKLTKDFSIGLMDVDLYQYDYNLADCIGNMTDTWGLSEGSDGYMLLKAHGKVVNRIPVLLQSNDVISFHLDLHNTESINKTRHDWSDEDHVVGSCKVFFNQTLVATIANLDVEKNYAIAATIPPLYSIDLLPEYKIITTSEDDIYSDVKSCKGDYSDSKEDSKMSYYSDAKEAAYTSHTNTTDNNSNSNSYSDGNSRVSPPVPSFFPSSRSLLAPPPSAMLPAINAVGSSKAAAVTTKPLSTSSSSSSTNMDCCICLSAPKCVLFMPCKHICVCEDCGIKQTNPEISVCPMCRVGIKTKIKVFI